MKGPAVLLLIAALAWAGTPPDVGVATASPGALARTLRVGGMTAPVRGFTVRVPQIPGQSQQFTLLWIAASGDRVKAGDPLAQFDDTSEAQNARDAKAKYDDFSHQVENQQAQNRSNAEQRASALQQAESDLAKAQLELKKAPILSAIAAQTDQDNLDDATAHVASLKRENALNAKADAAALKVLELERDQQQVEMQRSLAAVASLHLKAPLAGMVGLTQVFRQSGQGPAQPGDQLYSGTSIIRIFDPRHMAVQAQVNEADGAGLRLGLQGRLHLDAYPGTDFPVHITAVSPVAVSNLGVPIRTFQVQFDVDASDPRLLPDLSCSIDLDIASKGLLVPRAAVHFTGDQPFVSVETAPGQWRERAIELGGFNAREAEVRSGLRAGDQVRLGAEP